MTNEPLPQPAARVQRFLIEHGSAAVVRMLPQSTATAREAADALGVSLAQIGKSFVVVDGDRTVVAVICGDENVDIRTLRLSQRLWLLRLIEAKDVFRWTGFRAGGVSPFALPAGSLVVVDERYAEFSGCYVAAGHPRAVVQVDFEELVRLTQAQVARIAAKPDT